MNNLIRTLILTMVLFLMDDLWALKPLKEYISTPDSFGLNYVSDMVVNDSVKLKTWKILPAPVYDRKTTIIIANGDAGNMSYTLNYAYALVMNGFTVICFDYRGFGASSAFKINNNYLYYNEFATDLGNVIRWSKTQLPGNKTGVLALSMGTALTTIAFQTESLDFIIAEGMVYNPFVVAIRIKNNKGNDILLPENADKLEAMYENINCKMLVFAGTLDLITTLNDSKLVVKQDRSRTLVSFNGNHLEGMEILSKKKPGDKYIQKIIKFLK